MPRSKICVRGACRARRCPFPEPVARGGASRVILVQGAPYGGVPQLSGSVSEDLSPTTGALLSIRSRSVINNPWMSPERCDQSA